MYFETSEKLNGTFSPEREEVLKFLIKGAHIIWSFLLTRDDFFYEDISHHYRDTHTLYYHCTRCFAHFGLR